MCVLGQKNRHLQTIKTYFSELGHSNIYTIEAGEGQFKNEIKFKEKAMCAMGWFMSVIRGPGKLRQDGGTIQASLCYIKTLYLHK